MPRIAGTRASKRAAGRALCFARESPLPEHLNTQASRRLKPVPSRERLERVVRGDIQGREVAQVTREND
jgi:hypothetical protein